MFLGINILLLIVQASLGVLVGYLLLLTAAAWRARKHTPLETREPRHRFLILVPAHNEERLLPELLASLDRLDYPKALYSIHVVADNCSDNTADFARRGGATAHSRMDHQRPGKGYALQWLYNRLLAMGEPHDAVVFLDADSVVSPNFLEVMAARLARGERAIQAYYAVRNPERSWVGSMRALAFAVLHYLRPQGRTLLGGSAGLKGNGMAFSAQVIRRHEWSASVTEDIELHMALLLEGERVTFAPEAVVWGEMPDTLAKTQSQHSRWEGGRLQLARRYVPQLLNEAWTASKKGLFGRAFMLFDAAMEHLIPPFSVLLGLSGLLFLSSLTLFVIQIVSPARNDFPSRLATSILPLINLVFGAGLILGQLVYLFSGLRMAQAPEHVYRTLLYAPRYMLWKIRQYVQVLHAGEQRDWVRTTRHES